jgi:hypothetical protein
MKRKTNFELYLEDQLKDRAFADGFRKAGEEWGKILKVPLKNTGSWLSAALKKKSR